MGFPGPVPSSLKWSCPVSHIREALGALRGQRLRAWWAGALRLPRQGCEQAGFRVGSLGIHAGPSAQKGQAASCSAVAIFKCNHFRTRGPHAHVKPGIHT